MVFSMTYRASKNRGQFLIEAMVAISIITIGLLGILTLLSNAISLNRVVSDEYTATYLASEGIEVVKSIVDFNIINSGSNAWNEGLGTCPTQCEVQYDSTALRSFTGLPLKYFDDGVYAYNHIGAGGNKDTIFFRTLSIELVGSDQINVNSKVSWVTRGGITFNTTLSDVFTNWR